MKSFLLYIFFLFVSIASLFAQTGNNIIVNNIRLDSLKKIIEQKTDLQLFYLLEKGDSTSRCSLSSDIEHLTEALNNSLKGSGYTLTEVGSILYILKAPGIITQLPDNFFTPLDTKTTSDTSYRNVLLPIEKTVTSENKIYRIGDPNIALKGNKATLTGYVKNINTGEPIVDAAISVDLSNTYAITDLYGFYKILVPIGKRNLTLKSLGMEDVRLMLEIYTNGELEIFMKEKVYSLRSVTILGERDQFRRSAQIGVEKIQVERMKRIPTAFGVGDVMKVVLTLPGVKSVGESSGGFNVRGGATDQNLILFNDGTIYNPTHLFGLFSVFNSDVINDAELYKSSIPAKYGGRISSVLDISSRNGNSNKITGSASIGLLTGIFHVEGPIIKEHTTFILGTRITYSDWILGILPESSGYKNGSASFYDITAGVSHKINNANSMHLYAYYSADGFKFSPDTGYKYNNLNFSFKWRSKLHEKHQMLISAGYDRYEYQNEEKGNIVNAYNMRFGIEQFFFKTNFNWMMNETIIFNYGLNAVYFNLSPGILSPVGAQSEVTPTSLERENAIETALYIGANWKISERLSLDAGIRYTYYAALGPATYYEYQGDDMNKSSIIDSVTVGSGKIIKPYYGPEFRFSARYIIRNDWIIKTGINTMRQNIHMISNNTAASPVDTWKLSDANIVPQTGWQTAAGVLKSILNTRLDLSIEGYYKEMKNYLDYKSGAVLSMNASLEQDVIKMHGKAYGIEFMAKKPLGKLNGWLSYSYSRTMLRESGEKETYNVNQGNWYPAAYDKPHEVKLVGNYKFTQRYSLSFNFDYATGRPVTIPISKYYLDGYRLEYSNRNSYRIPDYIRIDLAFNIEPSHNLKLLTHSMITLGVYNLTGRKNAFSVYYDTSSGQKVQGYKLSIFGAPIPYINYTIKF